MSSKVKQESDEQDEIDEKVFSRFQVQIDRLKEQIKQLRKLQTPVKKRLRARMETEGLESLQCGEFVLTRCAPEHDEVSSVIFNEKKVTAFFDEDLVSAYMNDPENQRKSAKRPRFTCKRQIVDLGSESDEEIES